MMQTDVKASHRNVAGTLYSGPCRLKGLFVFPTDTSSTTACTVQIKDGGSSGTTLLQFDMPGNASLDVYSINIPGEGIKFNTSMWLALSGVITGITVFYG